MMHGGPIALCNTDAPHSENLPESEFGGLGWRREALWWDWVVVS